MKRHYAVEVQPWCLVVCVGHGVTDSLRRMFSFYPSIVRPGVSKKLGIYFLNHVSNVSIQTKDRLDIIVNAPNC